MINQIKSKEKWDEWIEQEEKLTFLSQFSSIKWENERKDEIFLRFNELLINGAAPFANFIHKFIKLSSIQSNFNQFKKRIDEFDELANRLGKYN